MFLSFHPLFNFYHLGKINVIISHYPNMYLNKNEVLFYEAHAAKGGHALGKRPLVVECAITYKF